MKTKPLPVFVLIISILLLTACNLPSRPTPQLLSQTSPAIVTPVGTPTPVQLCDNPFFPSTEGDTWEYSGTNSVLGAYTRTDTITAANSDSFALESQLAGVSYLVQFSCSSAGLIAADPIQQYAGAILSSPDAPVNVKLGAVTGTTLPAKINPGDSWQQSADFEASSSDLNLNGRFVFDYTAVGYENTTVAFGTFNALRVDTTITIELTRLHIKAGTYTMSTWMVPGIGIIKSQGSSHVPQVDFTDSMELNRFASSP